MRDIFDEMTSLKNLFAAWSEFRRGKRGRKDVQAFERHLEDHVLELHDDLVSSRYRHGSYHRFHVFDPKHRVIHKATVRDRLVHHAIYCVLYPIFDRSFIYDSYSCRVSKGTHAAVDRLGDFARRCSRNYSRTCWALKLDIKKFFDSVDHELLLADLKKKIDDPRTMSLLGNIVGGFQASTTDRGGVGKRSESQSRPANRQPNVATLRQCLHERI